MPPLFRLTATIGAIGLVVTGKARVEEFTGELSTQITDHYLAPEVIAWC